MRMARATQPAAVVITMNRRVQPCGTNNVCTPYDATDGGGESCNFGSHYTGGLWAAREANPVMRRASASTLRQFPELGGGGGGSSGRSCGNCGGCCQPLTPCTNKADCCSGNCSDSNNWCLRSSRMSWVKILASVSLFAVVLATAAAFRALTPGMVFCPFSGRTRSG